MVDKKSAKPVSRRIFRYDFIRALGMMMVFMFHFNSFCNELELKPGLEIFGIGFWGRIGVELFLLMSGTLSYFSMKRCCEKAEDGNYSKAVRSFYLKRVLSLMPMFYIAYFIAFVHRNAPLGQLLKPEILYTVLGLDGYVLKMGTQTCYLVGEWFMGLILLCYLACPLLYLLIKKYPRITLAVLAVYYVLVIRFLKLPGVRECNILIRIVDFAVGMYFAKYLKQVRLPAAAAGLAAVAALKVMELTGSPLVSNASENALFYIIMGEGICLYIVFQYIGDRIQNVNNIAGKSVRAFFGFFADYSYPIYLLHSFMIWSILSPYRGEYISPARYLIFVVYCAMIVTTSAVLLSGTESWLMGRIKNMIKKK